MSTDPQHGVPIAIPSAKPDEDAKADSAPVADATKIAVHAIH